jgi:uncharacterized membrane protein YtjA (UPF0391 family)
MPELSRHKPGVFFLNPKPKTVKMAVHEGFGLSVMTSKYILPWHLDFPSHFQFGASGESSHYHSEDLAFLNWIITFFVLAIITAVIGFGGLAGTLTEGVKYMVFGFLGLFFCSLLYSVFNNCASQKLFNYTPHR